MIYLDNNATTQPSPAVIEAMRRTLGERWHNPSSVHRAGQAARAEVELARRAVAELVGASPREVVFTSGGTESVQLGILGLLETARARGRSTIVTSAVEHAAVRDAMQRLEQRGGVTVRRTPVLAGGVIDLEGLRGAVDEQTALVSLQWANNETGAIQPVEAIGAICRERGAMLHCDATQWVGKMPTDISATPIDAMTFAAHKFHGPKGVGALVVRRGVRWTPQSPGSQELGRRGGTENTPGIVGMGVAAREAMEWLASDHERTRLANLRDRFEQGVLDRVDSAALNAPDDRGARLWNTTNIGFPPLEAEALLILLSERGVAASAGAACSSGSLEPSPVLLAMGIPEPVAHASLRFSLSRHTTDEDIDQALKIIPTCVERLRASTPV